MDFLELIKLNRECQVCERLKHNGGKCLGTTDKVLCILFVKKENSPKISQM